MSTHPDGTMSPTWAVPAQESSWVAARDMEELPRQGDALAGLPGLSWLFCEHRWNSCEQEKKQPLLCSCHWAVFSGLCIFCCICGVILTLLGPGVPGSLVAGRSEEQPEHPSQSGMQDVG